MLPEFLAVVRDNHDQRIVEKAELLQFPDELLQAPVVVQDFAVIAVDGPVDEAVGVELHRGCTPRG